MTSALLRDALKRGLDLHKSARLEEALTWYRAAIAIDADDAEANRLLGLALVHSGRGEEGISHLRRAVELEPDQLPFRFNLVQGLQQAAAYAGAIAELGVILAREPSNFFAWELAGDIAGEQGDNDGAAAASPTPFLTAVAGLIVLIVDAGLAANMYSSREWEEIEEEPIHERHRRRRA